MQDKEKLTYLTIFLGCKVNAYEMHSIANILEDNGYSFFNNSKNSLYPTVVIINTCAVTETSVKKDRKIISSIRKKFPNSILIVMGCYSHYGYNDISNKLGADIVIGTQNRNIIINLINDYKITNNKLIIQDSKEWKYEKLSIKNFGEQTRAYVKIQDGCDNFCSYCLIPFVRGKSRSREKDEILSEINTLIENDYKEVVLTGIDMSSYGEDIYNNYFLSDLIEEILVKFPNLYRLRISSIEESKIDEKFISLFSKFNNFAHHLHIPLQSGSEKILSLMRRKYDLNNYFNKVNKIKNIVQDISITTDVIVGFPNENDDDFNDTYNFCKKIKFSKIHVFPYSNRSGTLSSKMENQVDVSIKKDRVSKLLSLSKCLEEEFENSFLGKKLEFLMEDEKNGYFIGHSSNFLKIKVKSKNSLKGKIITKKFK